MTLFSTNTNATPELTDIASCDTMGAEELERFVTGKEVGALTQAIINSEKAPRGARRAMAAKLIQLMPGVPWYDTKASDTTDAAKQFESYRKAIVKDLNAVEYSNPAGAIKQIKEQGAKLAGTWVEPEKSTATGGAGDRERAPHLRIAEEVLPLFKAFAIPSAAQQEKVEDFYKANQAFEQEYTAEQIWQCGVKFQEILQILNVPLEQHTADS